MVMNQRIFALVCIFIAGLISGGTARALTEAECKAQVEEPNNSCPIDRVHRIGEKEWPYGNPFSFFITMPFVKHNKKNIYDV